MSSNQARKHYLIPGVRLILAVCLLAAPMAEASPCSDELEGRLTEYARAEMVQSVYDDIASVGESFRERFPPSQYYYIGLGRSPHGILAYLEAVHGADVRYVPMTNARFHQRTPENETLMRAHMRRFLPTAEALRGRKILAVDISSVTGSGLEVGRYYLQEAIAEAGLEAAIALEAVGVSGPRMVENTIEHSRPLARAVVHKFHLPGDLAFERVRGSMNYGADWLTSSAPVGPFDLRTMQATEEYSQKRPQYAEFMKWLREMHGRHL